jgi:hypothetical protein
MSISPFSLEHDWKLNWTKVPEHIKQFKCVNNESPKERRALEALACIGVIGGLQLSRLFSLDKKRKKKMVLEKKLVRHDIQKNNQVIPIYTLGINGAKAINMSGYENNYWLKINVEDMLGKLLFFQLYEQFPEARISPAVDPFHGVFFFRKRPLYVYSANQEIHDLLVFFKWKGFKERLIVVTESLHYLDKLLMYEGLKLRAVLAGDLHQKGLNPVFYVNDEGIWINEATGENRTVPI